VLRGAFGRRLPARSARQALGLLCVAGAAALGCSQAEQPVTGSLAAENRRPGTVAWRDSSAGFAKAADLAIWASPYAATVGDTLDLFIHALYGPLHLTVFRLGWYGGLGGTQVATIENVAADSQPPCTAPLPGPVVCAWKRTARLATSPEWVSGLYVVRVQDSRQKVATYPLVLRDDRVAKFAVVLGQLTLQAYNSFGGSSLYTSDTASPGQDVPFVSFERPYAAPTLPANILSGIHWLEEGGYDLTYLSDADLATGTWSGQSRTVIFVGHDEYWTWGERDLVEQIRNSGVHLVFLAGNTAYWNIRLGPGTVTGRAANQITCWKSAADPGASSTTDVTARFRDPPLNRPENALVGIMYTTLAGSANRSLLVSDSGVGPDAQAFLDAAGLHPGDSIPGLVGWEGDRIVANGLTPPRLQVLFKSPIAPAPGRPPDRYHTTFYVAGSGAGVFASGSNLFALGLEPAPTATSSPALRRLMANLLSWMESH